MQKDLWEREYRNRKDLPSSKTMRPSKAVIWYFKTYSTKESQLAPHRALDMGSGQGRNAIYLAKQGYDVVGVEIVKAAIAVAKAEAQKAGVAEKVTFLDQSVATRLLLEDASFDLIIDMMTLHLLNAEEREVYSNEVVRLLKPNGCYLFYTISANSPTTMALVASSPGPEPNSYVIPQSGMVEKGFTEKELRQMFVPLTIEHLEEKTEFTPAFGDTYERVYYLGLMRKEMAPHILFTKICDSTDCA